MFSRRISCIVIMVICSFLSIAGSGGTEYDICGNPRYIGNDTCAPMPDYVPFEFEIDWGKQGPVVIVCDCGSIIPAKGRVILKRPDGWTPWYHCNEKGEYNPNDPYHPYAYGCSCTIQLEFDDEIFSASECPGSPIVVGLVSGDCDTLEKAKKAVVKVHAQIYRKVVSNKWCCGGSWYQCDGWCYYCTNPCNCHPTDPSRCGARVKGEFIDLGIVATVSVKFKPGDFLSKYCSGPSDPGGGGGGGGGGGCSGGSCGSGSEYGGLSHGNAGVAVRSSQSETLSNYGSITSGGEIEANVDGFWVRIGERPGWSTNGPYGDYVYDGPGTTCTKIYFDVKKRLGYNDGGTNYEIYHYELDGNWEIWWDYFGGNQSAMREDVRGRIQLRTVSIYDGSNGNTQTKVVYGYNDADLVTTQTSYKDAEPDKVINYTYDAPEDPNAMLTGISAGDRTIGLLFEQDDNDPSIKMLTKVSSCPDCGGGTKNFGVVAAQANMIFDPCDPLDPNSYKCSESYRPSHYLISEIRNADNSQVLVSYDYDSRGRFTDYRLGDSVNGDIITKWIYDDDNNILIRRDYVNGDTYRARVYQANGSELITSEYHYHELQTGDVLPDPNSETSYEYESDEYGNLTKVITILPKGNKHYNLKSYQNKQLRTNVIQRGSEYGNPVTENQFFYQWIMDKQAITKHINAFGGITDYDYRYNNLIRRTDPAPGSGLGDHFARQVTEYEYDSHNRLTLERHQQRQMDATEYIWVATKYDYDDYGNLKTQIDDFDDEDGLNLTTTYAYNAYNELTTITDPKGNVRKTYYSNSGAVIGEAVYDVYVEDYDESNTIISAGKYTYDSNGWLITKSVVDTISVFSEYLLTNEISGDLYKNFAEPGYTTNLPWIHEVYQYDQYGRRTAVIADAGAGAERKNLTTIYEYNNQSEIVRVIRPDSRYTETVRDGRGLVKLEITGINDTTYEPATTEFFYDLNGNLTKKVNPEGVTEIYSYDHFDRMIRSHRVGAGQ